MQFHDGRQVAEFGHLKQIGRARATEPECYLEAGSD